MNESTITKMIKHMKSKINEQQSTPNNKEFYDLLPKVDSLNELDFIIIGKLLQLDESMQGFDEPLPLSLIVNEVFLSAGDLEYSLVLKSIVRLANTNFIFEKKPNGLTQLISYEKYHESICNSKPMERHFGRVLSYDQHTFFDEEFFLELHLNKTVLELLLKLS